MRVRSGREGIIFVRSEALPLSLFIAIFCLSASAILEVSCANYSKGFASSDTDYGRQSSNVISEAAAPMSPVHSVTTR